MDVVNKSIIDTITDEVSADVYMLHAEMWLWVMGAGHGALIVAE